MQIAIDDFGAGFSSLTRLRHLTVHILKLDRSFLAGVPDDAARRRASSPRCSRLARELDLDVVAEGIETPEQLEFLRGRGREPRPGLPPRAADAGRRASPSCFRPHGSGRGGAPS